MQEAVKAVIEYGLTVMKLQFIEAFPNPNHANSIKLLEKNSFLRGENFTETDSASGKILERVVYILKSNDSK